MTRLLARSFLIQLITLCTALGVLWTPVAEAAECSSEAAVTSLIDQQGEPGEDPDAPDKHTTCAHGHCHHANPFAIEGDATHDFLREPDARSALAATFLRKLIEEIPTAPPRA